MKKRYAVSIILGIVVLAAIAGYVALFRPFETQSYVAWKPVTVTPENVAQVIEQTPYLQQLPDESLIALYIGADAYTLSRGSMIVGAPVNPEITIRIPESYLQTLGNAGVCSMIHAAKINGELSVELHGSELGLGWKYRALAHYKNCLE